MAADTAAAGRPAIPLDVVAHLIDAVPHLQAIGLQLGFVDRGTCGVRLPWRADLVGDPSSGVVHGGVITTILDTVSGMAAFSVVPRAMQIATLDLRIDYLRRGEPRADLLAEAECYRLARNVAFVRGRAYQAEGGDIAASMATFMLDSSTLNVP